MTLTEKRQLKKIERLEETVRQLRNENQRLENELRARHEFDYALARSKSWGSMAN